MSLRQMLGNVRIRTRDPRAQQPSDRTLLVLLSTQVQNLLTEANLRGRYWSVNETEIVVGPNVAEYIVSAEGFGKPIEVRAVYPAGTGYHQHDVPFYELGDLNFEWSWPDWPNFDATGNGAPYGDQRVAFYRKDGNVYLRTAQSGPPAGTHYRIIYQIGKFGETMPLDDTIMLPEFSALVEVRTALSALPHCEWFDDEDRNRARREELAISLAEDARAAYTLFRSWVATQSAANQPNYRYLDSID